MVSPPGELIGMETDRPPANLRAITVGDRLEGDFLVQARADKTTRAGKGFALLTLANATGTIDTAPLWEEQLPWIEGVARGTLLAAVGEVGWTLERQAVRRQLNEAVDAIATRAVCWAGALAAAGRIAVCGFCRAGPR